MSAGNKTNTFVVQITYQQNYTWQGTVKWMEQKKEEHFRSALELISMIDDAVKAGCEENAAENKD